MNAASGQRTGVLLVEDDLDIREAIMQILAEEGYDVAAASNGQEALSRLRASSEGVGVILLDLMMPVMNGWQFREEQLRDPTIASIPVIVMSADASADQRVSAIRAATFLRKPIQLERLLDAIDRFRR